MLPPPGAPPLKKLFWVPLCLEEELGEKWASSWLESCSWISLFRNLLRLNCDDWEFLAATVAAAPSKICETLELLEAIDGEVTAASVFLDYCYFFTLS